jgi:RimJ/RimL family protein N-acetyltransferase
MTVTHLPIVTERLVLRPFDRADLDEVMAYHALPDVQRYLDWKARDRVEGKQALKHLCDQTILRRPGDTLSLAIVRGSDERLMGQVSLRWSDATAQQAELRFVLNSMFRGQGYATEAARAAVDFGFDHYHVHRIFARVDGRNQASAKLLRSLGMRLEAHFREHALFQGEWDEELHFAILDREWQRSAKVADLKSRKVA